MISTHPRLTGERPQQGVTPASLLSLHAAGYRAVLERLGPGLVLDVGTGEGFESARLAGVGRRVMGVDYSEDALLMARGSHGDELVVAQMEAGALGIADGTVDWVCSSHLIEHFIDPSPHVAEMARVLAAGGTAFVLTPNAPADFENPFHLRLFGPSDLAAFLGQWFDDVSVLGLDASARVKLDFAERRAKAARLLRLDVFHLRHRMPRSWYVAMYTRLLPLTYRVLALTSKRDAAGAGGAGAGGAGAGGAGAGGAGAGSAGPGADGPGAAPITADEWFVTDRIDDTTPVLFALCRMPRRPPSPALASTPASGPASAPASSPAATGVRAAAVEPRAATGLET